MRGAVEEKTSDKFVSFRVRSSIAASRNLCVSVVVPRTEEMRRDESDGTFSKCWQAMSHQADEKRKITNRTARKRGFIRITHRSSVSGRWPPPFSLPSLGLWPLALGLSSMALGPC